MKELGEYDAFEVNPVRVSAVDPDGKKCFEPCEEDDKDLKYWSVYGHIPNAGVECLADCSDKETAMYIKAALESEITSGHDGVFKYLDCNTGHVTKGDMELLALYGTDTAASGTMPMMVAVYPEGAWVGTMHTLEADELIEEGIKLTKLGFSEAFMKVLVFAQEKGCKYVCLDCDAEKYNELEVFEW